MLEIHYGLIFLLSLGGIVLAFKYFKKIRWLITGLTVLYLTSFIIFQLTISLGHDYQVTGRSYDYILIFGGGMKNDHEVNDAVIERLHQAILADVDKKAVFVCSGGLGSQKQLSEAQAMKNYLIDKGIDSHRILLEDRSTSTWENLIFSRQLIDENSLGEKQILGVSSDFHIQRIKMLAARLNFVLDTLPAEMSFIDRLGAMPREYFATVKSFIFDRVMDKDSSDYLILGVAADSVYASEYPIENRNELEVRPEHIVSEMTLSAVGDIMVHRTQLVRAYDGIQFDFSPSFQWVSDLISASDYAVGNLETTLAGENGQRWINADEFYQGYSGYPVFNAPDILAQNLKSAGFDLLFTANNHTLDSKESGVKRTLDILDNDNIAHTGTYASPEEALEPFVAEVNGIKLGVINYTYAMNGFSLDADEDYIINHLGNYNEIYIQEMYDKVEAMAESSVDVVVVAIHYGIEYLNEPDRYYQRPLIDGLFDHGADIILGGHPHVLQPFEVRAIEREDGTVEMGVVIYSLGNFISSQRHRYTGKDTDYGMIFNVDLQKIDDQKTVIKSIRYTPTYVYWSSSDLEIIPILEVPEEIDLTAEDETRLTRARQLIIPHLNKYWGGEWTIDGAEVLMVLDGSD